MSKEFKSCAHCGSENVEALDRAGFLLAGERAIQCKFCFSMAPESLWNRRAIDRERVKKIVDRARESTSRVYGCWGFDLTIEQIIAGLEKENA